MHWVQPSHASAWNVGHAERLAKQAWEPTYASAQAAPTQAQYAHPQLAAISDPVAGAEPDAAQAGVPVARARVVYARRLLAAWEYDAAPDVFAAMHGAVAVAAASARERSAAGVLEEGRRFSERVEGGFAEIVQSNDRPAAPSMIVFGRKVVSPVEIGALRFAARGADAAFALARAAVIVVWPRWPFAVVDAFVAGCAMKWRA